MRYKPVWILDGLHRHLLIVVGWRLLFTVTADRDIGGV